MRSFITSTLVFLFYFMQAQTVEPLLGPDGNQITIPRSEGYIFVRDESFYTYSRNSQTGLMNIAVSNQSGAYWLLEEEIDPGIQFKGFFELLGYGFGFCVGNSWYISDFTKDGTTMVYNSDESGVEFVMERLFMLDVFGDSEFAGFGKRKGEENAILIATFDIDDPTSWFPYITVDEVLVYDFINQDIGFNDNLVRTLFTAREYVNGTDSLEPLMVKYWDDEGFGNRTVLEVPGGESTLIKYMELYGYNHALVTFEADSTKVFTGSSLVTALEDVTNELPGVGVLRDILNMRVLTGGQEASEFRLIIREDGNSNLRYYYHRPDIPGFEIKEIPTLENGIINDYYIDRTTTLSFFYNQSDTLHGFTTYDINMDILIQDPVTRPVPDDFHIGSYYGDFIYYAHQDPSDQQFYCAFFDFFSAERQTYLKSQDDKRIKNPRKFWFMGSRSNETDWIVIESAIDDSVYLIVYDPHGVVSSTKESLEDIRFKVFPNPATNSVTLELDQILHDISYLIIDSDGRTRLSQCCISATDRVDIEVKTFTSGLYTILLQSEEIERVSAQLVIQN